MVAVFEGRGSAHDCLDSSGMVLVAVIVRK